MATPHGYILVKQDEHKPLPTPSERLGKLRVVDPLASKDESKQDALGLIQAGGALGAKSGKTPSLPPALDSSIRFRHKYRYVAQDASASVKTVTVGHILQSFGSMATSANDVHTLASAFKIHSITIYPSPNGVPYVSWDTYSGVAHNPDSLITKPIPFNITTGGGHRFIPPANSQVSWWQSGQNTSDSMFNIAAPVGSIVDVDASVCIQNVGTNGSNGAYSGLTPGLVYYPALDGRSTNDFAPVGRTNAT